MINKSHIIFSVQNPLHTPKVTPPSHEQAIEWLRSQGEDVQEALGHNGPEQSIIITNPKNPEGIKQLAADIGQESLIESDGHNHKMHFLNGPSKGKTITGTGTKIFPNQPPDNYTAIKDPHNDIVYFQHHFDFPETVVPQDNTELKRSEDLIKAPIPYDPSEPTRHSAQEGLPDLMGNDQYKHIKSITLPNGLEYRQFTHRTHKSPNNHKIHAIYDPRDNYEPLAYMETMHEEEDYKPHLNAVQWAEVHPNAQNKGIGKQLYLATLAHGTGNLTSDKYMSHGAHGLWESLSRIPGLEANLAPYGELSGTGPDTSKRHTIKVTDKDQLMHEFNYPFVNLNKSESDEWLAKAVDDKTWKRIQDHHNKAVRSDVVDDHGHIAYFNKPHNDYQKNILDHPETVKADKFRGLGVSPKMIHPVDKPDGDYDTFMSKPYHQKNEAWASSWVKHPIRGWAALTNSKLYDAAGISDLNEDLYAHSHKGVPIVISKFSNDTDPIYNITPKFSPLPVAQINIMDFLTNNQDRHVGNIRVKEDFRTPLAIDHDRSFQYFKPKPGSFANLSPVQSYRNSGFWRKPRLDKVQETIAPNLVDWWTKTRHNIKQEMENNLNFIKDPHIQRHIRDNFNHRWEYLNDVLGNEDSAADMWTEYGDDESRYPSVSIIPYQSLKPVRSKKG